MHTQEDVDLPNLKKASSKNAISPKTLLRPGLKMNEERTVILSERRPKRNQTKSFFPEGDPLSAFPTFNLPERQTPDSDLPCNVQNIKSGGTGSFNATPM